MIATNSLNLLNQTTVKINRVVTEPVKVFDSTQQAIIGEIDAIILDSFLVRAKLMHPCSYAYRQSPRSFALVRT